MCDLWGNKKQPKERQLGEIQRFKAQFEEIVCHLLHSWKIAPEYSWFADNPLIVISIKTFGRLEAY